MVSKNRAQICVFKPLHEMYINMYPPPKFEFESVEIDQQTLGLKIIMDKDAVFKKNKLRLISHPPMSHMAKIHHQMMDKYYYYHPYSTYHKIVLVDGIIAQQEEEEDVKLAFLEDD